MVRLGLIVMVLALAGCSAVRDAVSANAKVAGTAAGQTLTVDRLAQVVGRAQRIPIQPTSSPAWRTCTWTTHCSPPSWVGDATCTIRPWCSPHSGR